MRNMIFSMLLFCVGCTQIPDKVKPVDNFDLNRYLGKWYEIARLDHSFERGLSKVTAAYSLNDNGSVSVLNRGYSEKDKQWKAATGIAYFIDSPTNGLLKVSFFRPFYGTYAIFELDRTNYQYAVISGPNHSYLWILSRTPTLSDTIKKQLIQKAANAGFNTQELIFVDQ
nr:lipocalin family protein [uncultured Tolumonas sp.]